MKASVIFAKNLNPKRHLVASGMCPKRAVRIGRIIKNHLEGVSYVTLGRDGFTHRFQFNQQIVVLHR